MRFINLGIDGWILWILDYRIQRLSLYYGGGGILRIYRADPYIQPNLYTRVL